ncbi:translation initiation factor IF-2-like [Eriocheir sinensis]|uniref:translation initiation factor IF-2-like n=1 Tax=Eriocheir sinensis TaxID=95602 RepID=UPI0021C6B860|nr:translation initiation factor IF-2-like [Eriocheir sinensis]
MASQDGRREEDEEAGKAEADASEVKTSQLDLLAAAVIAGMRQEMAVAREEQAERAREQAERAREQDERAREMKKRAKERAPDQAEQAREQARKAEERALSQCSGRLKPAVHDGKLAWEAQCEMLAAAQGWGEAEKALQLMERPEETLGSAESAAERPLPDFLEDLAHRIAAHLTEAQTEVCHTLAGCTDVSSGGDLDLGRKGLVKHINTGNSAPTKSPPQ